MLIGASLSEPHTSVTTVSAYVRTYVRPHRNIKLNENEGTRAFQICTRAETSATKDSSPCNSTLINLLSARDILRLEREERATARLRRRQTEQEGGQNGPR